MDEQSIAAIYDKKIIDLLTGKPKEAYLKLSTSKLINTAQEFANIISITRLSMNDHGWVHMRKVTYYAIIISNLLRKKGIRFSGESEGWCTEEDSFTALIISAFLHDTGMSIHRERHEFFSLLLMNNYIDQLLDELYTEEDHRKKFGLKALILESIAGHMGYQAVASVEAGILLVADGCDLEFGRAKPVAKRNMLPVARIGDIHRYSALTVTQVLIQEGEVRPVKIVVTLDELAGFFQIEEVLLPKVNKSPIKEYLEIEGITKNMEIKKYL